MNSKVLPLSGDEADVLYIELNEEILRLEGELARFHELPEERRLASPEVYRQQISVRRELLTLLEP